MSSGGEEGSDREDKGEGDEYVDEEGTSSSSSDDTEPSKKAQGATRVQRHVQKGHQPAEPTRPPQRSTQVVSSLYPSVIESIQWAYDCARL